MLDWNMFAEDLTEQKDKFRRGNQWQSLAANPHMHDEANAKEHFAFNKSTLAEVLEDVYFPLICP